MLAGFDRRSYGCVLRSRPMLTDEPDADAIEEQIVTAVVNEICEFFQ